MIVIACVDDKMGMMFNNRRQSRDRVLINRIEALTVSSVLWMSSYSQQLFPQTNAEISDTFMEKAANGEYCFVENACLTSYENEIEKIILFKWNRRYPADKFFDIDLSKGWKLISVNEFAGSSHEKITMEVYEK